MADPRLLSVELDEGTILSRSPEIEREREVAMTDLLHENRFAPVRATKRGQAGPYRLFLRVVEGRLVFAIADAESRPVEEVVLGLARFRRPVRDYFAICDSYFRALAESSPAQIETVDMARRAIHNDAATTLKECLDGKIEVDFDTARRLFTLICVLHIKG